MKFFKKLRFVTLVATCCLGVFTLTSFSFVLSDSEPKVILAEDTQTYTMSNGIVSVQIAKASGDLVSLRYKGLEMLATSLTSEGQPDLEKDPPGANPNGLNKGMTDHQYGFWSHDAMGPKDTGKAIATITINPNANGGERAEVSIKGISNGRFMGTGPGAKQTGQFVSDIEIRYTLEKGTSGVYTYCVFEHKPEYPLTQLGEARFCAKLADFFDWLSVAQDPKRDLYYTKDMDFGDKYVFTDVQSQNRAFGWSSTTKNVGLFFINASMEYMSGGPTKVEFLGHRDTNKAAAPTTLNYWRSSHYGGAEVNVAGGEDWTKVIGPFLIYVNSGRGHEDIYTNARATAVAEAAKWPYAWVKGVDYPLAAGRAIVKGKLTLNDPIIKGNFANLMVGLTAPAYVSPAPAGMPRMITDWQRDAKFYQFWEKGNADGSFTIPYVRPGKYTLHAYADGVLGEYTQVDVIVESGKPLNLGNLTWTPVRKGKQLWEVGIPNRDASEFFMASEYNNPFISIKYASLFPNDVIYTIGKSHFSKDWFFQHVPHSQDLNAQPVHYRGATNLGNETPYTVAFDLPNASKGKATLRFAICGTGTKSIVISVNGKSVGMLKLLSGDGVITRHGKHGIWYEKEFSFDAKAMKIGENKLTITVPAGSVNNGMMYDYIRLELDENGLVK